MRLNLPVLDVEIVILSRVGLDFVFDSTDDHPRPSGPSVVRQVLPADLYLGGGVLDTPLNVPIVRASAEEELEQRARDYA